jgi:hypothetical protein
MVRARINYFFIGFCLLLAIVLNFGVAFYLIWSVTPGATLLERLEQIIPTIIYDSSHHFPEFIQVVVLPFLVGLLCLGTLLIVMLAPPSPTTGRVAFLLSLLPSVGMILYTLLVHWGVHVVVFSLPALILAWWEYHKQFRSVPSNHSLRVL